MPDDASDLTSLIETLAAQPKLAEADGLRFEAQDIAGLAAADKAILDRQDRVAAQAAAKRKGRGLRFNRLIPPDAA